MGHFSRVLFLPETTNLLGTFVAIQVCVVHYECLYFPEGIHTTNYSVFSSTSSYTPRLESCSSGLYLAKL